jgi:Pentapeptide repeats (8 copies)
MTVLGTSDRQIILNSTVQLPVLNVALPLNGFFLVAPIIILIMFVYLQISIQRLKGLIVQSTDGYQSLDHRRLYPWLLTIALDPEPGMVGTLQRSICSFVLWWTTPSVLLLFAFWFIKKHDHVLCYVTGAYPLVGLAVVLFFWNKYVQPNHLLRLHRGVLIAATMLVLADLLLLILVIPAANSGRLYPDANEEGLHINRYRPSDLIADWTSLDLSYQVLITEQKKEYNTFWVDLENSHLEGANLTYSILKLANMKGAHLRGAQIHNTTLRAADLRGADFLGATIAGTDFAYANLTGVKSLEVKQMCNAKTLYKATLEPDAAKYVQDKCPYLLTDKSQDF